MTILDLLARSAARLGPKVAFAFEERVLSFADLGGGSNAAARVLRAHGVGRGDRVAIVAAPCVDVVFGVLGALRLGAIVVPANPAYRDRELAHILGDAAPRAVLADRTALAAVARSLPGDAPAAALLSIERGDGEAPSRPAAPFYRDLRKASFTPLDADVGDDDPALLLYTSGTTGRAKGALHLHGGIAANARSLAQAFGWTEEDHLVHALPLFHVHGLCVGLFGSIAAGSRITVLPRFDAGDALHALRAEAATMFMGVPTMYARLVAAADRVAAGGGRVALPAMRLFVSGSAPLPAELARRFRERFGHAILERYGMTETLITLSQRAGAEREPGNVGRPLDGIEARVAPDGELLVRGSCLFRGYWNDPDATRAALLPDEHGGAPWFRTGDLVERDARGDFAICGRSRDLVITGGFNVHPREVEEVLLEHPAVAEAAVYGAPHDDLGECVVADVVLRDGATPAADDLVAHCRERLAPYKKPHRVRFVAALPRNALGKVVKHRAADPSASA